MIQLTKLLKNAPEIDSRYGLTKELTQATISISDPRDRLIRILSRKEDLIAQIAETLWVMGGSNEVRYLSPFLKRAVEFSDDEKIWRSGYGERIRNYPGGIDQLKTVIEILKKDLYSRRAFLVISYPPVDLTPGKDIACNTFISFLVRKDENGVNRLNMTVNNRSNDFIWGFSGINYFEFTFLMEFVARQINVSLGNYVHNSMSFHVYKPYFSKLESMAKEIETFSLFSKEEQNYYMPEIDFELEEFDSAFLIYKDLINKFISGSNYISIWEDFKTHFNNKSKNLKLFFEIPIVYLLVNNKTFLENSSILNYLENNYFNKKDLFFHKINEKLKKRINS